jgi:serine/threonine protein kinase
MSPASEKQTPANGESSPSLAMRLDLLLQHAITTEEFEADMVRACRQDPEEIWTLLALLDQHHRLETLPTEMFRALKASADRYGLVRREPYLPNVSARSRAPATARAPAAVAPPPAAPPPAAPPPAAPPPAAPPPADPPPAATPDRATAPISAPPALAAVVAPAAAAAVPLPVAPEPEHEIEREAAAEETVQDIEPEASPVAVERITARILEVGSVLVGRYRLEAELESDDRGRNFQALDLQHAGQPAAVCQVAVHCMEPVAASFESVLAERRAEFQLAQPLSHPNVLSVRDFDQDGVRIYLTMNFIRGETLAAVLDRRGGEALARSAAFAIIRDIGAALTYSHDHGVVHGNLQPQSILISAAGELRVRGFGAQRARSCYASCEQLEDRPPDRRDDLYALACISYELLHGVHPFSCQNASTARGRGISPARPVQLSGQQWRALRMGMAWRREGRNLSVERWTRRMHMGSASNRLPTLENLQTMPAPKRSSWRPVLIACGLAAAAAIAGWLYRPPAPGEMARLRIAVHATPAPRALPAAPVSVPATPAPLATAAPPAPVSAVQEASPPAPKAQHVVPALAKAETAIPPLAKAAPVSAPVPVPQSAPPTALASPVAAPAKPVASSASAPGKPVAKTAAAVPATGATRIELSADHYTVQPGDSAAHILVRRSGGARGEVSFVWWTENASASADLDFVAWGRRVERIRANQASVTLLVPIIKDSTRTAARTFYVDIGEVGDGTKLVNGITRAAVQLPGNSPSP